MPREGSQKDQLELLWSDNQGERPTPPVEVTLPLPPELLAAYPGLNAAQARAVVSTEGPVLLIAGPGAGKTLVLVARTLHILLTGNAIPSEIVLCTFTEKAALELRDRLRAGARAVGYEGDLSDIHLGTIHGICNRLVRRFRHRTPLGNGYEVLDELTQELFIFEHFEAIVGQPDDQDRYFGKWTTRWGAINGIRKYFDKITEELVDPIALARSSDPFVLAVAEAYDAYEDLLVDENRTDFAHLQRLALDLLEHPATGVGTATYVMVDEYQDTNYIQERLLDRLAERTGNLCVVGDEDQALYRFRGATVRNILEFPAHHPGCTSIQLTINYRSHQTIVRAYDRFMSAADWSAKQGQGPYRFPKSIQPDPEVGFPDYPAVFCIYGTTAKDEAERLARLVEFLVREQVVEDPSQVALLLHSVRADRSGPYLEALERRGIKAFCPRARGFFENEEVQAMVGALAVVIGYFGDGRGEATGRSVGALADYIDEAIKELGRLYADPHPLAKLIQRLAAAVESLNDDDALDLRPADLLYELLSVDPFTTWLTDNNCARNLATISELLNVFQRYYHYSVITGKNRRSLRLRLFASFFRLLHEGGINDYEDPNQPFPKGHVQVMTIHQAKGLEFPVVIVGSLDVDTKTAKEVDQRLGSFYQRPAFEPPVRISGFDRMRLHYVAFSRPEKLLVLTSTVSPKGRFAPIWQGLPQWPHVQSDLLRAQAWRMKPRLAPKKSYSFTGDLKVYETCPRQYRMYRQLDFTPSRSAIIFFGLLVHQTIEDVHRTVLDGDGASINDTWLTERLEFNFSHLSKKDVRPVGATAKQAALQQVLDYVRENSHEFHRVIETEVDVTLEKDSYILTGAVDLLLGDDGALEVLDFKSQRRPVPGHPSLDTYYKQLCIYAHILERRHGRRPDRLLLYWTGERSRSEALMSFPYVPSDVEAAASHFDEVVAAIQHEDFSVTTPPDRAVCKECDFRTYCIGQGTIDPKVSR